MEQTDHVIIGTSRQLIAI